MTSIRPRSRAPARSSSTDSSAAPQAYELDADSIDAWTSGRLEALRKSHT